MQAVAELGVLLVGRQPYHRTVVAITKMCFENKAPVISSTDAMVWSISPVGDSLELAVSLVAGFLV